MRIDIDLAKPLSASDRTVVSLALAALPKTRRVVVVRGGFGVIVIGEALGCDRVRAALEAEGILVQAVRTSLHQDDDKLVEEISAEAADPSPERFRPIGR